MCGGGKDYSDHRSRMDDGRMRGEKEKATTGEQAGAGSSRLKRNDTNVDE